VLFSQLFSKEAEKPKKLARVIDVVVLVRLLDRAEFTGRHIGVLRYVMCGIPMSKWEKHPV